MHAGRAPVATRSPSQVDPLDPFEADAYVLAFARYRHLRPGLLEWYAADLLASIPSDDHRRTIRFLDVGAGTGQFSLAVASVAKALGLSIEITMLEPSSAFYDYLLRSGTGEPVRMEPLRVEDYYPNEPFDLVLLSEIAHLFRDDESAFDSLRRLTALNGTVGIRYASRQQVLARNWYEGLAEAREIDYRRAPCAEQYEHCLVRRGFSITSCEVDETYDLALSERLGIVRDRAYSSFCLMSEEALEEGYAQIAREAANRAKGHRWVNRLTWMKARRVPT